MTAAERYARELLADLAATLGTELVQAPAPSPRPGHPLDGWLRSGLPWLCGWPAGPPVVPTVDLPAAADGALLALRALAPWAKELDALDGAALLGERAALLGLGRRGRFSPGGGCRLLRARDGWIALSLARGSEDLRLLPAWLERDRPAEELARNLPEELAALPLERLVERGRLLGLALAPARPGGDVERSWLEVAEEVAGALPARHAGAAGSFLVADLTSLWAGPLCADLLRRAGARVVKVESTRRPDGARRGPARFYDLLNAGKESVALDLAGSEGRAALTRLLEGADLVLEASRPRALAQLGVDAAAWVRERPGRTWLSLTGYGRRGPAAGWVAFGDDAAAAAGLPFAVPAAAEPPLCVGDAVADPLAGLHAAVAALASRRAGGSRLLDVALAAVARRPAERLTAPPAPRVEGTSGAGFRLRLGAEVARLALPPVRSPSGPARPMGADTVRVLV